MFYSEGFALRGGVIGKILEVWHKSNEFEKS